MITDLANLGPSLKKGTSDLGASRGAGKPEQSKAAKLEKPEKASSFEQIFQKTVDETKSERPEQKNVRAYAKPEGKPDGRAPQAHRSAKPEARPEPKPIQKNLETVRPKKPEVDQTQMSSNRNEPRTARKEKEDWESEEPGSVRKEESSEKVGEKTNTMSPQRENVMLKFMDSMESEFGIPPHQIVEAMTHIPESEQLSSPEDSASQVIGQLDLPPEQEQRALALYMGMLAALRQPAENTPKPFVVVNANSGSAMATPSALMSHQERTTKLNNSLDSMNQKFFMKTPNENSENLETNSALAKSATNGPSPEDLKADLQSQNNAEKLPDFMLQKDVPTKLQAESPLNDVTGKSPDLTVKDLASKKYGPAIPKFDLQSVDPNSADAKELMKRLAVLGSAATALNEEIKADPKTLQALKAEQALQSLNGQSANGSAVATKMGMNSDSAEDGRNLAGDQSSKQQLGLHGNHGQSTSHTRGEAAIATTSFCEALAASKANSAEASEKQESVQQLMKQAQYMVKKGGGEAARRGGLGERMARGIGERIGHGRAARGAGRAAGGEGPVELDAASHRREGLRLEREIGGLPHLERPGDRGRGVDELVPRRRVPGGRDRERVRARRDLLDNGAVDARVGAGNRAGVRAAGAVGLGVVGDADRVDAGLGAGHPGEAGEAPVEVRRARGRSGDREVRGGRGVLALNDGHGQRRGQHVGGVVADEGGEVEAVRALRQRRDGDAIDAALAAGEIAVVVHVRERVPVDARRDRGHPGLRAGLAVEAPAQGRRRRGEVDGDLVGGALLHLDARALLVEDGAGRVEDGDGQVVAPDEISAEVRAGVEPGAVDAVELVRGEHLAGEVDLNERDARGLAAAAVEGPVDLEVLARGPAGGGEGEGGEEQQAAHEFSWLDDQTTGRQQNSPAGSKLAWRPDGHRRPSPASAR